MMKNILKKILPNFMYNFIRMRPRIAIVSQSLNRKIGYINQSSWRLDPDSRGDIHGLSRKYAHILDKGLQSSEREPEHGRHVANILGELVEIEKGDMHSSLWARKILELYNSLQLGSLGADEYANFPYENKRILDCQQLAYFFRERRSLRHFDEESMPNPEIVKEILETTIWAPSSCNRQTIVNYFTMDEGLARDCTKQNKGATAISGKYSFVSVCYDSRSYHLPQESFTGIIDASLGFENALLMAHAMGLGACVLNWSHATVDEEKELRRLLNIPNYCEIVFNVIIGIPNSGAPVPGKKSPDEYLVER